MIRLRTGVLAAVIGIVAGTVTLPALAQTASAPMASAPAAPAQMMAPPQMAPPSAATAPQLVFFPLTPPSSKIVDEVKIGGLAHDLTFLGRHVESGADVNIEMLFTPPALLSAIGSPRPHIGADINTSGNTSDGYFGLTWGIAMIQNLFQPNDAIFLNGSLGAAVQDGYIDSAPPGRKRLGSPVLFRESAELGYQLTPVISVSALLDHISNANLGQHNAGITSAGARFGFKF
jgi:lipid A 3-O-deacylase